MVKAQNLTKTFTHQKVTQTVFENLNFQIHKQEFVSLLGPSGCGKSTLLRLIGGLDQPSGGSLELHSRQNSFVFQEPRLLAWRNTLENTLLPVELTEGAVTPPHIEKARLLLAQLSLKESENKYPHQLSGGMKMRNALARSLILNPDFLLFDEPFSALDETTRHYLQAELRQLFEKNKWTLVFVTHSIEEACFLSDRILVFAKDRQSFKEHRSTLPAQRPKELRSELTFFEEVQTVRRLFDGESK